MKYKSIALITLIISSFIFAGFLKAKVRDNGSDYLYKPTGIYNVGYTDYLLVNDKACPNVYYNKDNKDMFSLNNPKYCNEIALAVYYPTKETGSSNYHGIDSVIRDIKSFNKDVLDDDIKQIKEIKSHIGIKTSVVDQQFPVIFFSPGYGLSTQEYENIITEIVSHGYIIVGINSQFINGDITFNNVTVPVIEPKTKDDKKNLFNNSRKDLSYIYNLLSSDKLSDSILNKISFEKVGLLGHSLGAAVIAHFADDNKIAAIAALDLTVDLLYGNECHLNLKTPFMHMFSSQMYQQGNKEHEFPYLCKANKTMPYKKTVVIEATADPLYSMHMNFCDYSTLQYAPPIMKTLNELKKNPEANFLGNGDGRQITQEINKDLVSFFNKYLLN